MSKKIDKFDLEAEREGNAIKRCPRLTPNVKAPKVQKGRANVRIETRIDSRYFQR